MSFISKCLNGNGAIRATIIAVIVIVKVIPMMINGCVAEHDSYVKHYNEEVKELQK